LTRGRLGAYRWAMAAPVWTGTSAAWPALLRPTAAADSGRLAWAFATDADARGITAVAAITARAAMRRSQ
jgi:hypothetical protein